MREFLGEDFLLDGEAARRLFFDYAQEMPIFDYHCHLSPKMMSENYQFSDIFDAWLSGDHYKWRLMRANGVPEERVTGAATPREKFDAWAQTVPAAIGNPVHHWAHLELRRYFGMYELLGPETAEEIWNKTNDLLGTEEFRVRSLLTRMNVNYVGTTDDPADSLEFHAALEADQDFPILVRPSFRPDKAYAVDKPEIYGPYLQKLADAAGVGTISSFAALREALINRIDFFHQSGCRVSDHALILPVNSRAPESTLDGILNKARSGKQVTNEEFAAFATEVLLAVGEEYGRRGWVMQLHLSALRNNNSRMYRKLGPDTGFDFMADGPVAAPLAGFLDSLDQKELLPKTILYGLNPRDNDLLASMIGNFQDGSVPGKMQHGSAWWFNDQKDGMTRQMLALANSGLLSRFVGMLTDSRSFLSFPRHEYFRRLVCNIYGDWMERGEAPHDFDHIGSIIRDICYNNAARYFDIEGISPV
mgnify:CR=1 FL=1